MTDSLVNVQSSWAKYSHLFILMIALLVGGFLRSWNVDYGIPYMYQIGSAPVPSLHPDEPDLVQETKDILANPLYYKHFKYPPLHPQLSALVAWLTGHYDDISLYLIARWISIIASILTIGVVYRIGAIWGRTIGTGGAILLATCMIAAREAHWANPEPLAAFFLSLSFLLFYINRRNSTALIAGLCLGLSICAKYFGVLFVHLALVPLILEWKDRVATRQNARRLGLFALGCTLAVAAGLGFFVLRNPQGLLIFLKNSRIWAWGGIGGWGAFPPPVSAPHYFNWILPAALGLPAYCCAAGGVLLLLRRPRASGGIVFTFLPFLVFLEIIQHRAIRFVNSAVPFLCLAAAFLVSWAVKDAFRRRWMKAIAQATWTGVVCFSFLYSFAYIRCLDKTRDPRIRLEQIAQREPGRCRLLGVDFRTGTLGVVKYEHSVSLAGERGNARPGDVLFVPDTFRLLLSQWRSLELRGYHYTPRDWWPMVPPQPEMLDFIGRLETGGTFVLEERAWNRPTIANVPLDWFHLPFDTLFITNFRVDVYRCIHPLK